jgi:hypothetical protein
MLLWVLVLVPLTVGAGIARWIIRPEAGVLRHVASFFGGWLAGMIVAWLVFIAVMLARGGWEANTRDIDDIVIHMWWAAPIGAALGMLSIRL